MRKTSFLVVTATLCISFLPAKATAGQPESTSGSSTAVFTEVWETVSKHFYDPAYNGVDWDASKQRFESRAAEAFDTEELAVVVNAMLSELRTSHTHFYTRRETTRNWKKPYRFYWKKSPKVNDILFCFR